MVMKKYKTYIVATIIFLGVSNILSSQTTLNFKLSPIGIHPFSEKNTHLFENSIDANGLLVAEPCLMFGIETFIREDYFSFRTIAGVLGDAASKPAFFLNFGLKQRLFQVWRHSLYIGGGPSLYGRNLWSTMDDYVVETGWSSNGNWEYKVGIFAELEYAIYISDRHDILASLIYGMQPRTFSLSLGYRFWLSTEIKHPKPCGACPFQTSGKKKKKKKW
jgi:hypothetical protein